MQCQICIMMSEYYIIRIIRHYNIKQIIIVSTLYLHIDKSESICDAIISIYDNICYNMILQMYNRSTCIQEPNLRIDMVVTNMLK